MFGFGNASRIAELEAENADLSKSLAAEIVKSEGLSAKLKSANEDNEDNERLRRNRQTLGAALNEALKERDDAREEANALRPDAIRYRDQKARRCANLTPGGKPHKKRANGATAH